MGCVRKIASAFPENINQALLYDFYTHYQIFLLCFDAYHNIDICHLMDAFMLRDTWSSFSRIILPHLAQHPHLVLHLDL